MLPFRVRVDLGMMAMKGYSVLSKASALLERHHQIILCHIRTFVVGGILPLSREAVGVFYCPSRLGKEHEGDGDTNCNWSVGNGYQKLGKRPWGIGNQMKNQNYQDHSILKIGYVQPMYSTAYYWKDKSIHTFAKIISLKVNLIAR